MSASPNDLPWISIDQRKMGVGVRYNRQWWDFTAGQWAAFDAAKSVLACEPDTSHPEVQDATIPAAAMPGGAVLIEFAQVNGAWAAVSPSPVPITYVGLYPGTGRLLGY